MPIAVSKNELPLADYLAQKRKSQKVKLTDISQKTGVPIKYLRKMESGDWSFLPASVYAKGFLRKYARAVGLDEAEIIWRYELETGEAEKINKENNSAGSDIKKTKGNLFFSWARRFSLREFGLAFFVIFLVGYIFWQFQVVFKSPEIELKSPQDNVIVFASPLPVEGKVDLAQTLTVNGEAVYPEVDGFFKKELELAPGLNVIEIVAKSRFGKETKIVRKVNFNK